MPRTLLLAFIAFFCTAAPAAAAPAPGWVPPEVAHVGTEDSYQDLHAAQTPLGAIAVWNEDDGVRAITRGPAGWSAPEVLGADADTLRVASNPRGDVAVAWVEQAAPHTAWVRIRRAGAAAWEAPVAAGTVPQVLQLRGLDLALDAAGRAVAVWTHDRCSGGATCAAHVAAAVVDGGAAQTTMLHEHAGTTWSPAPVIAARPGGGFVAAWRDIDRAAPQRWAARSATWDGAWSSVRTLGAWTTAEINTIDVVPAGDDALVVWDHNTDGPGSTLWGAPNAPGGAWAATTALAYDVDSGGWKTTVLPGGTAFTVHITSAGTVATATAAPGDVPVARTLAGARFSRDSALRTVDGRALWIALEPDAMRGRWFGADGAQIGEPEIHAGLVDGALLEGDAAGNAALLWLAPDDPRVLHARGWDGAPPTIRGLGLPVTPIAGTPATFAPDAVDAWSPVNLHVGFGDGTPEANGPASHAYAAPGRYPVTVRAVDARGFEATGTGELSVGGAQAGPPPPPPPPGADTRAPTVRVSGGKLRISRRGTLRLSVHVDEAATGRVTLTLPRKRRFGTASWRATQAGTIRVTMRGGKQALHAVRRAGRRGLRATVAVNASDAAGNTAGARATARVRRR